MTSIIKADSGAVSGITGITQTADNSGTLELQATSGIITAQNATGARQQQFIVQRAGASVRPTKYDYTVWPTFLDLSG